MENTPFVQMYCKAVDSSNTSGNDLTEFHRLQGDAERFHYVANLPTIRRYDLPLTTDLKDPAMAQLVRKIGNDHFNKNELLKALNCYNIGIRLAHWDAKSEDNAIALTFANRSAVLLGMQRYEESLMDADRAVSMGYPKKQLFKLHLRKADILHKLGRVEEASGELEKYRHCFDADPSMAESWLEKYNRVKKEIDNSSKTVGKRKATPMGDKKPVVLSSYKFKT
jgi:tetratricopeptide (TPR) repeat protein